MAKFKLGDMVNYTSLNQSDMCIINSLHEEDHGEINVPEWLINVGQIVLISHNGKEDIYGVRVYAPNNKTFYTFGNMTESQLSLNIEKNVEKDLYFQFNEIDPDENLERLKKCIDLFEES